MKTQLLASLVAALALTIGCGKSTPPTGGHGVAVVDLDKVAQSLGWLEELSRSLQSTDTELRAQIDQIARTSVQSIENAKKEVSTEAKLTADQIQQLNEIQDLRDLTKLPFSQVQREKLIQTLNQANTTLQNAQTSYQQLMQQRRVELVRTYRDRVRPAAQQVAAEAGYSVVLTPGDQMLYFDTASADITEKVIAKIKISGAGVPFVAPGK